MTSPIIVALDYADEAPAMALVDKLDSSLCRLKVGKEMFTRLGPDFVRRLVGRGFDVFLDLKFHDIPNTVGRACVAAAELGVWMMNVHASGGRRMMAAAREALAPFDNRPRLIGVTVLTSLGAQELGEIGFAGTPEDNVLRLARLALSSGLDGVVCSPREAAVLRGDLGDDFLLVTPGVRPAGADIGDQRRVMTPAHAMAAGSSYLVVGRPITAAADPLGALREIAESLG
jgi:orotidine-5'-phosphate decarboxylase